MKENPTTSRQGRTTKGTGRGWSPLEIAAAVFFTIAGVILIAVILAIVLMAVTEYLRVDTLAGGIGGTVTAVAPTVAPTEVPTEVVEPTATPLPPTPEPTPLRQGSEGQAATPMPEPTVTPTVEPTPTPVPVTPTPEPPPSLGKALEGACYTGKSPNEIRTLQAARWAECPNCKAMPLPFNPMAPGVEVFPVHEDADIITAEYKERGEAGYPAFPGEHLGVKLPAGTAIYWPYDGSGKRVMMGSNCQEVAAKPGLVVRLDGDGWPTHPPEARTLGRLAYQHKGGLAMKPISGVYERPYAWVDSRTGNLVDFQLLVWFWRGSSPDSFTSADFLYDENGCIIYVRP